MDSVTLDVKDPGVLGSNDSVRGGSRRHDLRGSALKKIVRKGSVTLLLLRGERI